MTMMFNGKKILLVEQGETTDTQIAENLKNIGFTLLSATTLDGLEDKLAEYKPDFLLINNKVDTETLALIQRIRQSYLFKVLPLVVLADEDDFSKKWSAVSSGADGFLKKPVQIEELTLKIQALLRRAYSYQASSQDIFYSNLKLSPLSGEVFIDSHRVQFTATEYKLLETLVIEKGRPVRRESLAHKGLSSKNPNPRTIDVHINAIRSKLGVMGRKIKTLRGKGYMLVD